MIGSTISHYDILEQLGSGGMGVVYKARDTKLDRLVALKFLPPEFNRDDEANERFMMEAKAASALQHPNICAIHDVKETEDGRLYIVMPLYEGKTLKYRLKNGPLGTDQAIRIAVQIAEGLSAAHKKGIVHRDIKPANIMVRDDGVAVILDFGVAKLMGGIDLTKAGSTVGTTYYMSPEQIKGDTVDQRSDVWSLGVLLYEMLVGDRPFDGAYDQAVTYAILNREPDMSVVGDEVRAAILSKCLAKDSSERFQTAREVRESLVANESTSTAQRPVTAPFPPSSSSWKRNAAVAGVGLVLVALVGFFASRLSVEVDPVETGPARLVVLPFDNLGAPDDEYFSDGMTEEITSRLSSVSGLAVISRNTAARYKNADKAISEIGSELGVEYVLVGTVRWDKQAEGGDRVRIAPQLVRVSDDTNVWSDTYDRTIEGIFAIQSEVAERVVDQLNVTLLDQEREDLKRLPTENIEAYQAYLRGVALRRSETTDAKVAIASFELALSLDSTFVEAGYRLAHSYLVSFWLGLPIEREEFAPKAKAAVEHVSRLAPNSKEDHLARGYKAYYFDLDFNQAHDEFKAAAEISPDDPETREAIAYIKRRLGQNDDAAKDLVALLNEDPQNYQMSVELAMTYSLLKQYPEVDKWLEHAIRLKPTRRGLYCVQAEHVLRWTGSIDRTRQIEDAAPASGGSLPCWWADLAERQYDRILDNLSSVEPSQLGTHTYAWLFPLESMHLHFERALAHRFRGNRQLERASWLELLDLVSGVSELTLRAEKYRNAEAVSVVGLAMAHAGLGDVAQTRVLLEALRKGIAHDAFLTKEKRMHIALAYALIGDTEEAIAHLEEDLNGEGLTTGRWLSMPYWDSLRKHPRFQALVEKYGN